MPAFGLDRTPRTRPKFSRRGHGRESRGERQSSEWGYVLSQLFNLFRRAKNRSELSRALIDALPGQLNADAAAVAWYGEGGGVSDLLFTGIPAPVIQQYERCATEVDVVQAECVKAMRCVDSAMLFTDGEWQKQAMYREFGRPAKVYHHLVSPIVRESGVIGVLILGILFARTRNTGA